MEPHRETDDSQGSRTDFRPPLLLQSLVLSEPEHHPGRSASTIAASAMAHSLLFVAMIALPLVYYDEIPNQDALRTFFVAPLDLQAPPPPPPPPPPAAARRVSRAPVQVAAPETNAFVAPIEVPSEIPLEEELDLGVPGGVVGGVEGGVPGGVLGGVVGGLPLSPAPPSPPQAPLRVGGRIKTPVKITHVEPVYPDLAKQARVEGVVILECIIGPNGRVTDVRLLRGVPLLDQAALEAVKQWVYTPTLLNNVPVPLVMTVTVKFTLS